MKKKIKYFLIAIFAILVTGCSNNSVITDIDYTSLENMIDNKDSFILEVVQTGCSHCEEFSPRFKAILKEENLEAYSINLYNLTDKEQEKFSKLTTSVTGTPTVLYYKNGKETSHRIYGAVSDEKIKDFIKKINK